MGRSSYSNRKVLEDCWGLSISFLKDGGVFKKLPYKGGASIPLTQTRGCTSETIEINCNINILNREKLSYDNTIEFRYDYAGKQCCSKHSIMTQPVHFGGYRYYLYCGCCFTPVKTLYFGGSVFACRKCLKLVYTNCRYNRDIINLKYYSDYLQKKANSLRLTRHPRKANIMMEKARYYDYKHAEAFDVECSRRFGHLYKH